MSHMLEDVYCKDKFKWKAGKSICIYISISSNGIGQGNSSAKILFLYPLWKESSNKNVDDHRVSLLILNLAFFSIDNFTYFNEFRCLAAYAESLLITLGKNLSFLIANFTAILFLWHAHEKRGMAADS